MKKRMFKPILLLAAVLLLVTVVVSGLIAFLKTQTEPITNTFVPTAVTCAVKETFNDNVKSDVVIQNTGDIDAYIRATIVINWVSENDSTTVFSQAPVNGTDYYLDLGDIGWNQDENGFWYYETAIKPGECTGNLIDSCKLLKNAPEGYRLSVQVLASAIQASPTNVVCDQWGVNYSNGVIAP